jgi:CO dehydrogenase maturation factor
MGAGIEQLTRGTARGVDMLLIVTEPTRVSVDTAHVIQRLAAEMDVPRVKVIGNKIRSAKEKEFLAASFAPGELLGFLEFDETLWERAMMEDPQGLEEVLLQAVSRVFDQILREVGEVKGKTR